MLLVLSKIPRNLIHFSDLEKAQEATEVRQTSIFKRYYSIPFYVLYIYIPFYLLINTENQNKIILYSAFKT